METGIRGGGRSFPSTHWSMLDNPEDPRQLDRLIREYWQPVFHYIRALRRVSVEDAKDLTQQFFVLLLRRQDLAKVDPARGSFRGFLKTALRHFVIDAARAAKPELPLASDPEEDPEAEFDRAWARDLLERALARLEQEYAAEGRDFTVFREYSAGETTYEELASKRGMTGDEVRYHLRYARQRLREILRESLAAAGEDVEAALRALLAS